MLRLRDKFCVILPSLYPLTEDYCP